MSGNRLVARAAAWVLGAFVSLAGGMALAADVTLPHLSKDVHLGVASCAGSTCHGAVAPWRDSNVLQNEYTTWMAKDPHSKAYSVLLNDQSKRIAKNLGIPAAHEAKVCLDCHADNVAPAQRGAQFQISDGVGCEACHGGGERWLGIHVSGKATHAQNVAAGLFPTEDPKHRANLCLGCHLGDETRAITHKIMGAGHPRLAFELDTFTNIQPAHYRIDDDYAKRKAVANGVKTWAIGQAMALSKFLDLVADPARNRDGIMPEFVLYDCQSCHTPLNNMTWQAQATQGIGPGVPRLHGANAAMLKVIAAAVAPGMQAELVERSRALHAASQRDKAEMERAAKALKQTADKLADSFAARAFDGNDIRALMQALVAAGLQEGYADYASAEQTTMALSAVIDALKATGQVDPTRHRGMQQALEACYAAVKQDATYTPAAFTAALQQFQAAMPAF